MVPSMVVATMRKAFWGLKNMLILMQALADPRRMSLELLRHMLTVLHRCLFLSTQNFVAGFQQVYADC